MRKYFVFFVALVLTGCSDQYFEDELLVEKTVITRGVDVETLIEQARWGSGEAYLKLAQCYHDARS